MQKTLSFKDWFQQIEINEKDNRGGNRYKGLRPHIRRAFSQTSNFYKKPKSLGLGLVI